MSRRRVLGIGVALAAGTFGTPPAPGRADGVGAEAPVARWTRTASTHVARGLAAPAIRPRADWATGLPDAPDLPVEASGDVRVVLVHHSDTPNGYAPDAVARRLRSFHDYHRSAKGWPDVAYNFFVDAYGGIWEGRTGSLSGPVIGDATGGNQGFSQLCCFVGDHEVEPPTDAARAAMVQLVAWLTDRYDIDPTPGATTSFTSRGSNRWPAGATVTTRTIEGHRAMSSTTCPGDGAYAFVRDVLPAEVARARGWSAPPTSAPSTSAPPSTSTAPSSSAASSTSTPEETSTSMSTTTPASRGPASTPPSRSARSAAGSTGTTPAGDRHRASEGGSGVRGAAGPVAVAVGLGAAAAGTGLAVRRARRRENGAPPDPDVPT